MIREVFTFWRMALGGEDRVYRRRKCYELRYKFEISKEGWGECSFDYDEREEVRS